MSYRTYINNIQIFGNDEYIEEWFKALKSQGCRFDEYSRYKFEVKEFMPLLEAVENYVKRIDKERLESGRESLFDLSYFKNNNLKLTDNLISFIQDSYLTAPYQLIEACREHLDWSYVGERLFNYKIKKGHRIIVEAY